MSKKHVQQALDNLATGDDSFDANLALQSYNISEAELLAIPEEFELDENADPFDLECEEGTIIVLGVVDFAGHETYMSFKFIKGEQA